MQTGITRWNNSAASIIDLLSVISPCSIAPTPPPFFPMMPRSTLRRRAGLTILAAAFVSFLLSVTLWFTGSHEQGLFVGLWVPSILSFGCVALLISDGRDV